mmetsp:Transcript_19603/g.46594  ORF Transcript_19603/g.46594 Transcript_19603/m.46594 type:complete len:232 (+) Transcript_19603:119-814(+)
MLAAGQGHVRVTRALVRCGAQVDYKTPDHGATALWSAVLDAQTECIQLLLDAGADPNGKTLEGNSPIFPVVGKGSLEAVRTLIEARASVNSTDFQGATPMLIATTRGDVKMIKLLSRAGADTECCTTDGRTPLFVAMSSKQLRSRFKCVQTLIDCKADVNATDKDGLTPLIMALRYELPECVHALQAAGADINAATNSSFFEVVHQEDLAAAGAGRGSVMEFVRVPSEFDH